VVEHVTSIAAVDTLDRGQLIRTDREGKNNRPMIQCTTQVTCNMPTNGRIWQGFNTDFLVRGVRQFSGCEGAK